MCYTYVSVMFYLNTCFYVLVLLCRLLLLEEDKVNFKFFNETTYICTIIVAIIGLVCV